MKPTLKIARGNGSEEAEKELLKLRMQQSSCTRTVYALAKKTDDAPSVNDATNSESVYQHEISSRENIKELNYWLKQGAIKRACQTLTLEEERRKEDDAQYESNLKQIEKLNKKKDKLNKEVSKQKNKIYELNQKLKETKTELKRVQITKKINAVMTAMSKKSWHQSLQSINKELNKLKKKNKSIDDRRSRNYNVIFGTRSAFYERCKGNITNDEFKKKRLMPLYSVGDKEHGNRLFEIREDGVLMKVTKDAHFFFPFKCVSKKYKTIVKKIIKALEDNLMPATIQIDDDYIYITYDNEIISKIELEEEQENKKKKNKKKEPYKPVLNRIYACDGNPIEYGCACLDWKSSGRYWIVKTDTYILLELIDAWFALNALGDVVSSDPRRIKIKNTIEHWTAEIANHMVADAMHQHAEVFAVEGLSIKPGDMGRGADCNAKCNNLWYRTMFYNCLERRCEEEGIFFLQVAPEYSSFEGNLIFRKHLNEPDMNLAAMEISRRGFELYTQHIAQRRAVNTRKNVIFSDPHLFKESLDVSEEEIGIAIGVQHSCDWKKRFAYFFQSRDDVPAVYLTNRGRLLQVEILACARQAPGDGLRRCVCEKRLQTRRQVTYTPKRNEINVLTHI